MVFLSVENKKPNCIDSVIYDINMKLVSPEYVNKLEVGMQKFIL